MKPTKEMIETTANALAAAFKAYEDEEYIHVENIENAAIDGYFDLHDVAEKFLAAMPAQAVKTQNITREEAIEFLERACRNWSKVPHLSDNDLFDVAVELTRFSSARTAAAIEPSDPASENERLRAALERIAGADFLDLSLAPERSAVPIARAALERP